MKFKVEKGTETFTKLTELKKKVTSAREAAKKVLNVIGADKYCQKYHVLAGGISSIQFDKKPEGYKAIDPSRNLYYPKKTNKEAIKLIESLPVVQLDELNKIANFDGPQFVDTEDGRHAMVNSVGIEWGNKNYMLIEVDNACKYNPPSDMIELLESEYQKLSNALKGKKK